MTREQKRIKKKRKYGFPNILSVLDVGRYIKMDSLRSQLLFLLFLVGLGIVYIGNHHLADRNVKAIIKSEKDLEKLKWEHVSLKSAFDQKGKQSAVAQMVESIGLKEITKPPIKVTSF